MWLDAATPHVQLQSGKTPKGKRTMNRKITNLVSSSLLALALVAVAGLAQAAPKPLPPQSNAFGKGYAELAADWLEWALAIPAATNPILDPDGAYAAMGQSGKVWFLAGNFGGTTERTITVPNGTALFFPIVNYFWVNTPEYGDDDWSDEQAAYVRGLIEPIIDSAQDLVLEIDGRVISNVYDLRVYSEVGLCTLPDDNLFGIPFEPVPHECVADGYWALLPPLSVGEHTIRFAGSVPATNFSLDVTYHVTVKPRHKVAKKSVPLSR
jgi:hypothetical protein